MPLLHRKPFVRRKPPADLKPDEEVFYCRVTGEIFRNYDDFFERTILCNSLVWSCAITGKPGLTYQEAVESEAKARQNLQNFPEPLVVPILYLTTLTYCSRLHELCDDLYMYTQDRYFAGEIVEVTGLNGLRQTCKVLEVLTPPILNGTANGHISSRAEDVVIVISDESDNEERSKGCTASASIGKKKSKIDVALFKYKVKPLKTEGNEILIKAAQMNRKKNQYSRDKLKLFLKQHCELRHGILKVKPTTIDKYKLSEQNFSHLFPDDLSTFTLGSHSGRGRIPKNCSSLTNSDSATDREDASKYKNKPAREIEKMRRQKEEMKAQAKRRKEEELANELKKRKEILEAKKREKEDKEKKKEELKKILEQEKIKRKEEKERLKLEKEREREKLREEKKKYAEYLKEWNKPREDMECEDLKELPSPTPVKTRLPSELFGDALMVLEFLHAFGELFDLQDEFPDGVTLESLEEALVGNDTEGPLCELLFFFLTAIFQAHAEEEEEVAKEQLKEADPKDALDEDLDSTKCAVSAVAAFAAAWPQLYQGCSLRNLDLDSCTLSEILRLHILAAGADVTPANAKYRYQQQGGFDTTDDACVEFRMNNPELLKKLTNIPVYDLTSAEKLKVLHALCGQLLTLVSTRDFIEDNVEILKQARQEFRELKAEQHRRGREEAAARYRKRKEERLREQEQRFKDRHDRIKEEQRNSKGNSIEEMIQDTTREEFDTSTESQESAHRDHGCDTATEDEEELGSCKKGQKGKKNQIGFKNAQSPEETEESVVEKREILSPEEEEVLKCEQLKKEKELGGKIQNAASCTNILPLGRDRMYRRYWVLSSVPGLFVEEDYEGLLEDMLQPCPVKTLGKNLESQGNKTYDKAQGNESSGNGASGKMDQKQHEPHYDKPIAQDKNSLVSPSLSSQPPTSDQDQILDTTPAAELHRPINKPNRWCFYSSPEQLDQLIEALNSRGNRENSLKETLLQEKKRLTELLTNFPVERFHIPDKAPMESKPARNTLKGAYGAHDSSLLSADKQLELRLKDLLLDIEDRTWQGTLGGIKVMERYVWRAALETGQYELLGKALPTQNGIRLLENDVKENGVIKIEGEESKEIDGMTNGYNAKAGPLEPKTETRSSVSTSANSPRQVNSVVRYLAVALLQLEQGIERKFLKPPLGDSDDIKKEQKDKKKKDDKRKNEDQASEKDDASDGGKIQKTLLDRWRESLLACTSLAQVFLHLSTLDRSIIWAKSLLNARCKICHKKGDAENMLLCDGCDRGHHTYCLRPKVKIIPDDDWFCPECRPKQRFRRTVARQRPSLESEEEEDLAELDKKLIKMQSEEDKNEAMEENETEREIEMEKSRPRRGRPPMKLQIKGKRGKSSTKAAITQQAGKRKYTPRSQSNTPKLTTSFGKNSGRRLGRKPKSASNSEIKRMSRSFCCAKSYQADESFSELPSPRRRQRYQRITTSTPEYNTSASHSVNISDLDILQDEPVRKKRKYTRRVQQKPTQVIKTGRRGRKRKSADAMIQVPKVTGNRRSSSRHSGMHELSLCEQLIVDLVRHEDSWPFLKLVNKAQVTDYYDIIKKPVALNIIREKLNRCEYNVASDFIDDVELMFTNCFEYNPRNTSEAKAGIKLQAFFHNQVEKLGLTMKPANVDHPPQPPITKRSRI
ncbi:bromodomain adjacent to zinc finger domain protein 1A isoform X2 [Pristis pectinata]|uniref:bromodomain adjacent to zinc finger domain protein 1A isoform X2 n=1 Tax=Pristis pectinata TaxID=685728 RepID=UPI00223D7001|nr:bromodomain adjacent to zinc finger domain protein 1A isoform X2 [Pristis pectinata]